MSRKSGRTIFFNAAVFIILEVASLCILSSGAGFQRFWIGRRSHDLMALSWGKLENLHNYLNLIKINDALAEDVRCLSENTYTQPSDSGMEIVWQNTRTGFQMMTASVVTGTTGSQHNYFVVDRGSEDGVRVQDGIITAKGVIGVVESVSQHYSFALSYANQNMVISAKIGREGPVGSLSWDGLHTAKSILSGIPVHIDLAQGDTVFTSGYSSIFPKDIPLGIVEDKKINSGSSADITVKLFEDFSCVHYVIIVQNLDKEEIQDLTQ